MLDDLKKDIRKVSNLEKAKILSRFFKTGKGEYGEGDVFLGITVPVCRTFAIKYKNIIFSEIRELLKSKIHEERLIALLILVHNFTPASTTTRKRIFEYYLASTKYINNWDLVDLSADKIAGEYLLDKDKNLLIELAHSKNLWERRIAMIATYTFIKKGEPKWTFRIASQLIYDQNDLIQKAVGWMLREVGKRCGENIEEEFLIRNYNRMGRTALRYAIERFDEKKRREYLFGRV